MDNKKLKEALEKNGITDEFLLTKVNELITAIERGESRLRNKTTTLKKLTKDRELILTRITQKNASSK